MFVPEARLAATPPSVASRRIERKEQATISVVRVQLLAGHPRLDASVHSLRVDLEDPIRLAEVDRQPAVRRTRVALWGGADAIWNHRAAMRGVTPVLLLVRQGRADPARNRFLENLEPCRHHRPQIISRTPQSLESCRPSHTARPAWRGDLCAPGHFGRASSQSSRSCANSLSAAS